MDFFNINDRYYDLLMAESVKERFKQGALMVGAVVANSAIAAGKVAGEVVKRLPDAVEKESARIKDEAERKKKEG